MISKYDHDEQALFDAGIDYAIRQLRDLIEGGADGIHLYAMNRPTVAQKVYEEFRTCVRRTMHEAEFEL